MESTEFTSSELNNLDTVIQSFEQIQAELNYRQAQEVLQDLVNRLDLTPRERAGLEAEIASLDAMLNKLEHQIVQIAVFGMVGRGKSSLLNALLGQNLFETGAIHGVTQAVQTADWQIQQETLEGSDRNIWRISLPSQGKSQIQLIDTPGIDEVGGEVREQMARDLAKQADLILFVVAGDLTRLEYEALAQLRQASKPILLVFNKVDQYPTADRLLIYQKIRDERIREILSPDEIVMAAASPLVAQAVRTPEGELQVRLAPSTPQVDALKLKILEILHREGKSLVALNTLLYADDINEKLIQRKLEIRDRYADQIIWKSLMTKAVAIAVNPLMVLDLVSGTVIDIAMIVMLSKLYGIPMTQQAAIKLLRHIALDLGAVTTTEFLATVGLGSLKSFFGLSAPWTGGITLAPYVPVAIAQAGIAGVSSYIIGQVTKAYLVQGATWGPHGPKTLIAQILDSLDEDTLLSRIKTELRAKLDPR
jgi:hypothetical protein